jgi:hypothetical protein
MDPQRGICGSSHRAETRLYYDIRNKGYRSIKSDRGVEAAFSQRIEDSQEAILSPVGGASVAETRLSKRVGKDSGLETHRIANRLSLAAQISSVQNDLQAELAVLRQEAV